MARLSDTELHTLKTEVSLVRLVESQGFEPKKQGNDYVISCPFHEEDTPSLIISPKNNLFHCFGCDAAQQLTGTPNTRAICLRDNSNSDFFKLSLFALGVGGKTVYKNSLSWQFIKF